MVKNLPANAGNIGDIGLIAGWGRSPAEENDNPFQDSCLEDPMGRGSWWAMVQGVAKSQTSQHTHTHTHTHITFVTITHIFTTGALSFCFCGYLLKVPFKAFSL